MQHGLKITGISAVLGLALGCGGQARVLGSAGSAGSGPASDAGLDPSPVADAGAEPETIPCDGVVRYTGAAATEGTGQVHLQLVAAAASGTRYRLKNASFILFNVGAGTEPITLDSETAPDADALDAELPAGEYVVSLLEGWSLQRLDGDAPEPATAGLLSASTGSFRLAPGSQERVRFRFEVSVPGVQPTSAAAAPGLDILERPALSGRVCVESGIVPENHSAYAQAGIDALEGCTEIRGELYVGSDVSLDLQPLHELRRVCGSLTISNTPIPLPDMAPPAQPLTGLEALEEIDALVLLHAGIDSFAPLRSLRRIRRPDPETDVLGLYVMQADLQDFTGLESLTEIQSLNIDNSPRLASLNGIHFPAAMRSIYARGPLLEDISALGSITRIGELTLSGGVQNLDALSGLRQADILSLFDAPELQNIDGLRGLEALGELYLSFVPKLSAFPELPSLTMTRNLHFIEMPSLAGALSLPALTTAEQLFINGNTGLGSVSLPALTSVGELSIAGNTKLESVDVSALSNAPSVYITGNPSLDDTALRSLQGPGVKIGNNQNPTEPLTPCPWTQDNACDEPGATGSGLCAEGTDTADCNLSID